MFRDRLPQLTLVRACALAAVLLLAQALVLAHGVLHEPAGPSQGRISKCEARRLPDEPARPPERRTPECEARRLPDARAVPAAAGAPLAAADLPDFSAGAVPAPPGDHVAAAWGGLHDAGDVKCRLIDQLGHADAPALGLAAWLPPAPDSQPPPPPPAAPPHERPAAAFCARAPPR